jgi:hypothetical protein
LTRYPPKLSGNYHRSWALVKKCLAELEERGLVYPNEKCVNYEKRFRAGIQSGYSEEVCLTDIADVSSISDARSTNLYLPRFEKSPDLFTRELAVIGPSRLLVHLLTQDAPVQFLAFKDRRSSTNWFFWLFRKVLTS